MISINNVTFGYNKYQNVLEDFSLQFKQGGIYGLLGKNGTGKSTMLYLIAGLLRPQKGEVLVNGVPSQQRLPETLQDLFIVPEEYDLPHISLQKYVDSLRPFYPRFSDELLERCLEGFGMAKNLDLGSLSMGQKKKAYMCIALATNTRYLLMDEPTNGLDILSKSQFRKVVVGSMSEDKTIIISSHQVHDVEHILDHVCIIDSNRVLLNTPITEDNGPVDLERLFIDIEHGDYVPGTEVEEPTLIADETLQREARPARKVWEEFLSVARWDVTVNRKFYIRQVGALAACLIVPIIYTYLMLIGKFHFFNAAGVGAMMAAEQDVIAASYYFSVIYGGMMIQMFCYMFHNLVTKQGRINELTLPAANGVRFLWHVVCSLLGTVVVFYLCVLLADLIHVILGWIVLGQTEFQSLTLATWHSVSIMGFIDIEANVMLQLFGLLLGASFLSTFSLGSAYKYRHTFGFVLLMHIACWLSVIFFAGMAGSVLLGTPQGLLDFLDSCSPKIAGVILEVSVATVFVAIWWLTYRLYCRAQVTSKRNP